MSPFLLSFSGPNPSKGLNSSSAKKAVRRKQLIYPASIRPLFPEFVCVPTNITILGPSVVQAGAQGGAVALLSCLRHLHFFL